MTGPATRNPTHGLRPEQHGPRYCCSLHRQMIFLPQTSPIALPANFGPPAETAAAGTATAVAGAELRTPTISPPDQLAQPLLPMCLSNGRLLNPTPPLPYPYPYPPLCRCGEGHLPSN